MFYIIAVKYTTNSTFSYPHPFKSTSGKKCKVMSCYKLSMYKFLE
jgi:hypothetical protein